MIRTKTTAQKGFGVIEIILILAVLALLGFVGWKAWEAFSKPATDNSSQTSQQQPVTESEAPAIQSKADLDKATQALDTVDIDGTESQDLDTQTKF